MKSKLSVNNLEIGPISLAILDKDGTIFDIHHYWLSMMRLRSQSIIESYHLGSEQFPALMELMGSNPQLTKLKAEGPIGVKPRSYIENLVWEYCSTLDSQINLEDIKRIFKEVDAQSSKQIKDFLKLLPGVENFLVTAKQLGVRLAIATTDITARAKLAMEESGLANYFDLIVGADEVAQSKPAADIGLKIMTELGVDPSETIMIGDHKVDIQLAQAAQMKVGIAVLTGLSEKSEFDGLEALCVENFTELSLGRA